MNIELSLSSKNGIIIANNYSLIRLLKHTLFEEICGSIQRNLDTEHYTNILNYLRLSKSIWTTLILFFF